MKINNNIKRLLLFVASFFLTLWSFAQTQYDYYEGKDAYGGVDTAIKGLKILGIIILVVAIIVIVGGLGAKFMDFINPPHKNTSPSKPMQNDLKSKNAPKPIKSENTIIEHARDVVITISGELVSADVTLVDGSKWNEVFWHKIESITYNLSQNITNDIGDEKVKPAGSTCRGSHINKEDVRYQTTEKYKTNNLLRIYGAFDPKKLHLLRIEGLELYDSFMYYYDDGGQKQRIISDKEAENIVNNSI